MDRSKWITLLIVVLLLGAAVFAYNQRSDKDNFSQEDTVQTEQTDDQKNNNMMEDSKPTDQSTPPETANAETMNAPTAGADTANLKSFTITGSNFKFSPSEIRVKKGDTVEITFINQEGFHDLVIDGYTAKTKQIKAGEKETIGFTATKAGSFEIYCSVGSHRAMGMVGKLIVE